MIAHHSSQHLVAYAAGASSEADSLLVACHLTLCPQCRHELAKLEAVGGALLEQSSAASDNVDALLQGMLGRLDEPAPVPPPSPAPDPSGVLPAPLAALVGSFAELRFKRIFPGVGELVVPVGSSGMPVRLFELQAGSRVPDHKHKGEESSLVLTGGFTDDGGHFQRGDVCVRGEEQVHRQQIDDGEPCVVLTVADHPLIPMTVRGWVAGKLRKI